MKLTAIRAGAIIAALGFSALSAQTVVPVTADITTDTTWDSDTDDNGTVDQIYFLDSAIFVGDLSGATRPILTITPGTVIAATGSTTGTNGLDVGTLVVTRDGAINADGTADAPIIFTSLEDAEEVYGIDIDGDLSTNNLKQDPILDGGAWGGVIILGNAPINFYDSPTNNVGENAIEGFAVNAGGASILYGGSDAGDNSGVFRYASLRFGGFEFATDEEINGLTMGGVGAGTTIEYVEVVGNTDDGFEWFGGTVNTKYLFSLYCQDESFDLDEGHQGTHQFWFALQSNESDYGTEADGGNRTGSGVKTGEPLTLTKIFNATYVGADLSNDAFRLKDNFAGQFHNSIFTEIGDDPIRIDDADTAGQVGVNINFTNNIFNTPGDANTHGDQPTAEAAVLGQTGNVLATDPLLSTVTKDLDGQVITIDPRPAIESAPSVAGPAYAGSITPGAPVPVCYKGAFGTTNWAAGWTYADAEGIFADTFVAPAVIVEAVTTDITVDTTWDSDTDGDGVLDKIYFIDSAIFVGDLSGSARPTLTIEPGTVIAATGSTTGTNGLDVGTLVITRDGAINAEGLVNKPIVFTSLEDAEYTYSIDIDGDESINDLKQDPILDGGAWGGVIILGNAPINFYDSPTNNVGENAIEGFAVNAGGASILYGGSDAGDNSGILKYASLRFGGFEFATDEEINGLTMGGVGAKTVIEYVEVVGNTDDGFEWFGGTVSCKYLFSLYCQDESFDIDEGHQGTHQFLFAVQSNESDYGTEADGGNRTGSGVKTGDPLTLAKVFNATYIGADLSNDAFRLKDNYAGQFHNGIFTEIGDDLIRIDDADTAGQVGVNINFTNNIFGTPGDANTHGDQPVAEAAVLAQTGNVLATDPQLLTVVKDIDGQVIKIDPRPALAGPAWGTTLTAGALCSADYRGAFGINNWAKTWTYASAECILVDSFSVSAAITVEAVTADITADTTWDSDSNGDGLLDTIYFIDSAIFVGDLSGSTRPTLTIEPGTVIAATGSTTGTNGLDVGTLVVTRNGAIDAEGEANAPIIFTSLEDAEYTYGIDIDGDTTINTTKQDPILDGGAWGGVIILGNAPINFYDSPTNNVGENAIEGFAVNAGGASILYGGNVSNDDSGILKYASLRFGGFEFATDEEINGLTMGGVGSDTTIEFVEVVGNTDDGFEWFGGTVSCKWLFSLYCQDESFDIDEGHQGTHQFFFALQSNESDYGTEADGGNRTGSGVKTGTPLTLAKVYNATYVGADLSNDAFRLKDNYAGQFHNGIFTNIGDDLIRIDDADTAGQVGGNLCFSHNIFGTPGDANTHGDQPVAEAAVLAQLGNVLATDPQLSAVTEDIDGQVVVIDPRPVITGPAWGTTLLDGAPMEVDYRGAFGTNLWTNTWSYGSNEGIVVPCFSQITVPAATIVVKASNDIEIESIEVLSNGDVEITVVGDAAGITVLQSDDLGDTDAFAAVPATIVGSVITVAAADADPNADGADYYQLVK